jgi:hypothetical protein
MRVTVETDIQAPPEAVWRVVADIENATETIGAIEEIEILQQPTGPSIAGLKWRETRTMFGKKATEVMWVTDAADASHYETRAESHGSVYQTRIAIHPHAGGTRLSMDFSGQPVSPGAKILWALTGFFVKGAMRKALERDLADIKAAVEG